MYDRQPDQQQCCVAVAFKGAAWTDPDSIPLMVMQTLLGGWDRNNTSGKHAGAQQGQGQAGVQARLGFRSGQLGTRPGWGSGQAGVLCVPAGLAPRSGRVWERLD